MFLEKKKKFPEKNIYDIFEEEKEEKSKGKKKIKKYNLRSNILTQFSNFIISFLNDYSKNFLPFQKQGNLFKKIKYKLRKINIQSIKEFMNYSIYDFCKLEVSSRYNKNQNFESLQKVKNYFKNDFLDLKLFEFYQKFFLSKDFSIIKQKYGLSSKTQNFEYYLNNFNNLEYKKNLRDIGEKLVTVFINLNPQKNNKKNLKNEDDEFIFEFQENRHFLNEYLSFDSIDKIMEIIY